jgi:hypothetical protein
LQCVTCQRTFTMAHFPRCTSCRPGKCTHSNKCLDCRKLLGVKDA